MEISKQQPETLSTVSCQGTWRLRSMFVWFISHMTRISNEAVEKANPGNVALDPSTSPKPCKLWIIKQVLLLLPKRRSSEGVSRESLLPLKRNSWKSQWKPNQRAHVQNRRAVSQCDGGYRFSFSSASGSLFEVFAFIISVKLLFPCSSCSPPKWKNVEVCVQLCLHSAPAVVSKATVRTTGLH